MRIHRLMGVGALAGALVLSGASLADATRGQPDHPVPITAAMEGTDYIVIPPPEYCPAGSTWEYHAEGIAQMSHLGRVDVEVVHCTTMDFATGTGFFGPGTMTFTAKNGDQLVLEDTGTFVFDGVDSVIDLDWVVIGGSGRFLGAMGEGHGELFGNVPTARVQGDFWGEVIYDASNRANR